MDDLQSKVFEVLEDSRLLIAQGKTAKALEQLVGHSKWRYRIVFLLYSSRLSTVQRQYDKGHITIKEFNAAHARISESVLKSIAALEKRITSDDRISWHWLLLFFTVGMIIAIATYYSFKPDETERVRLCLPDDSKKKVLVASFLADSEDMLSAVVIGQLHNSLEESIYTVNGEPYLQPELSGFRDTIDAYYFEMQCDSSGLFVNGLRNVERNDYQCYINIFRLEQVLEYLKGSKTIALYNPNDITFSIQDGAEFLADFILAILDMYDGNLFRALERFHELERNNAVEYDEKLRGYIEFFKGNCYALRGNVEEARKSYYLAEIYTPKLNEEVRANRVMAENIYNFMNATKHYRDILILNLQQDSTLRNLNLDFRQASPGSLQKEGEDRYDEPEVVLKLVEAVKNNEEDQANPSNNDNPSSSDKEAKDTPPSDNPTDLTPTGTDAREGLVEVGSLPSSDDNISAIRSQSTKGGSAQMTVVQTSELKPYPSIRGVEIVSFTDVENRQKLLWTAENIKFEVSNSWCFHDKDRFCNRYGRLYTWNSAKMACQELGDDWHLPSPTEWASFLSFLTNSEPIRLEDGSVLKFLPLGGERRSGEKRLIDRLGPYRFRGEKGLYWTNKDENGSPENAVIYQVLPSQKAEPTSYRKEDGLSCRCVKRINL